MAPVLPQHRRPLPQDLPLLDTPSSHDQHHSEPNMTITNPAPIPRGEINLGIFSWAQELARDRRSPLLPRYFLSPREAMGFREISTPLINMPLQGILDTDLATQAWENFRSTTLGIETFSWDYVLLRGLLWACAEENTGLGFLRVQGFTENHGRFDKVDPLLQQAIWDHLREDFNSHPPANATPWPQDYPQFLNQLTELGPRLPQRIRGIPAALHLLENHRRFERGEGIDDSLTVYIAPTADYNGAFTSDGGFPLLDRLLEMEDRQVLYFEAGSETEMTEILQRVRERSGRDIDVLIIAGHGTPFSLALGNPEVQPDYSAEAEGQYLTPEDFVLGDFAGMENTIAPEGEVILYSCSTGVGGAHLFNLANAFALALPGRRILSPQADTNIAAIFSSSGNPSLSIKWQGTSTYLAYQSPGAPRQIPLAQPRVISRVNSGNGLPD